MRIGRAGAAVAGFLMALPAPAEAQLLLVDAEALLRDDRRALSGEFIAIEPGRERQSWSIALSRFETLPPPVSFFAPPSASTLSPYTPFVAAAEPDAALRHHDYVGLVNAELGRGRRRAAGGGLLGITIDQAPAGSRDTVRLSGAMGALQRLTGDDR